jgi:SpoVK/Ycf46/Vps4 family AAA+-type ATPase
MAATNRPDIIDPAVLRPERLGTHLYVPVPEQSDRYDILKTITRSMPMDPLVDLMAISSRKELDNFTGADLRSLCENAAKNAAWNEDQNKSSIDEVDFEIAISKTKSSIKGVDLSYYDRVSYYYTLIFSYTFFAFLT